MLRFIPITGVILTAVALTSCSAPTMPPQATAPVPAVVAVKPATAKATFDAKTIAGFKTLQGVVSKTKTAVTAGNFAQANQELAAFEPTWKTIEDGIAAKSTATYTLVEKSLKAVEVGLKSQEKADTLKALTALNATLAAGGTRP
jgi:hypothetical protein